jgi:hypothetical protein
MNINRENYEAFFLDYHEGALTEAQVQELMCFLSQNPDLRSEFESFELITLDEAPAELIPGKDLLKKSDTSKEITTSNFDEYCIAMIENELDEAQALAFQSFIKDKPELEKTYKLYLNTKLNRETEISFGNKTSLQKFSVDQDSIPAADLPTLETALVAYHEGDLNDEEKRAVLAIVSQNGEVAGEFVLLKKTKLKPDKEIVYPFKSSLKRHVLTPGFRQVWYYAAAAAVIAFMFSLYFLWQSPDEGPQIAGNNSSLMNRDPEPQLPPEQQTEAPVIPLVPRDTATLNEPARLTPVEMSEEPARQDTQMIIRALPQPLFVAEIVPNTTNPFNIKADIQTIVQRNEFAYWSARDFNIYDETEEYPDTIQVQGTQKYTSFASLAYSGIERTTGIDLKGVEETIANRNFNFWDFAGAGLAGISQLTGMSLTVDKERDENGKITYLAIGENFRIRR